jgi:dihydroxyacetone kinase-like predicted kinase
VVADSDAAVGEPHPAEVGSDAADAEASEAARRNPATARVVAGAMARAATVGARGNSGIILSQVLRGFGDAAAGDSFAADELRFALRRAAVLVREALSDPIEGTMLTVLDAAAHRAGECARDARLGEVATAAASGAVKALGETPSQLDVLRTAGVVDAGARGLLVLLDALVAVTTGLQADRPRYTAGSGIRAGGSKGVAGGVRGGSGRQRRLDGGTREAVGTGHRAGDGVAGPAGFGHEAAGHMAGATPAGHETAGGVHGAAVAGRTAADETPGAAGAGHSAAGDMPGTAAAGDTVAGDTAGAGAAGYAAAGGVVGSAAGYAVSRDGHAAAGAGHGVVGGEHVVGGAGGYGFDGSRPQYEVMYVLSGTDEGRMAELRRALAGLGDSVVVVGDGAGTWSVHVHTAEAGAAVEVGLAAGVPRDIRIEGLESGPVAVDSADRGILTVAFGAGAAQLFEDAGAVVLYGDVTADALLTAILAMPHHEVLVLANGALPAHELVTVSVAARGTDPAQPRREVLMLPSGSTVQGLAALAVHDAHRTAVDDVFAMSEAAAGTRWGAVRVAAERALTIVGTCARGDGLGLVGHDVVVIDPDVRAAATTLLDRMLGLGGELVTLLVGCESPAGLGDELSEHITATFPGVEVVVYDGGQPVDLIQIGVE